MSLAKRSEGLRALVHGIWLPPATALNWMMNTIQVKTTEDCSSAQWKKDTQVLSTRYYCINGIPFPIKPGNGKQSQGRLPGF
jgi:hypothetical protein